MLLKAHITAPYAIKHVEEAQRIVHDPDRFYDLEQCSWAFNILARSLELLSAEHYPTKWSFTDLCTRAFPPSSNQPITLEDLLEVATSDSENMFLEFFRDQVVPSVLDISPDLVGLSITYQTQLIPSLALAHQIKQAAPSIHICVGGAFVKHDRLWSQPKIFSVLDSIVIGEGEHALLALIQALESKKRDLSDVPNLVHLHNGLVQHNAATYIADMNTLPSPDWEGLPLDAYFSPAFIPVLPTARGCYWGQCAFCRISHATSGQYRPRRIDLVLEDMEKLYKHHGATHFFLSADAESPTRMKKLACKIKERKRPFVWKCETRLSPPLSQELCESIFAGGCRYLIFGMESASQRVLDCMNKGIQAVNFADVIHNCYQAGIGVNLQTFIGFPTETQEEARATVDFLAKHHAHVDSIGFGNFALVPLSRVDLAPERYGVTKIDRECSEQSDIVLAYDYQVAQGMSQEEAAEQLRQHFLHLRDFVSNAPATESSHNAFLYITHYGLHKLEEKKNKLNARPTDLLNTRLKVVDDLSVHRFDVGDRISQTVVFSQSSGEVLIDNGMLSILDLCKGSYSTQEIATMFADRADTTKEFIVNYMQSLNYLKRLCEKGILEPIQKGLDVVSQ
jgi:hypothetical protein